MAISKTNVYPLTVFQNDRPVVIQDEKDWIGFSKDFKLVHAAGGIVRDEEGGILMIYRLGRWDFPKGKVEPDESWEEAALREVQEETGLHGLSLLQPSSNTYHTYTLRGIPVLKITHWYPMRAAKQPLVPQTEEDIRQAEWVPRPDVDFRLKDSYLSLKTFWQSVGKNFFVDEQTK